MRELIGLVDGGRAWRIRLRAGDVRVEIDCDGPAAPTAPAGEQAAVSSEETQPAAADAAREGGQDAVLITAPLMGVFYRRPAPDRPPFAEVGQRVEAGEQIAIVEAMKTMNPVRADRAGVVTRIHVEDGEVVEFQQPLMSLEPC
ncbi:MAG: acetyl-CoA carboxylase biotin carboxyl carrier protein [Actinomadura rubrobrunea]|nr:acetyl-CoA carboxylase biotin carboxyl carrier protein [Actinomadura rubrobrunea]